MKIKLTVFLFVLLCCGPDAMAQHEHHHSAGEQPSHDEKMHAEHMGGGVSDEAPDKETEKDTGDDTVTESMTFWTCSMHPQIRLKKAGQCPICNMDLIAVEGEPGSHKQNRTPGITVDASDAARINLETTAVERKWVERRTRLVGQIDYDETRVKHITAWVPGRIERLFVDFTGIEVKQGDHMVSLYSPELVSAQEELVQASRSVARSTTSSERVRKSSQRTLEAAREKLKLLGLSARQVAQIERRGSPRNSITIFSPIGGVVVQKHVNEGIYVQTGTRIYTVADLSHLWLNLEAYESDLPWIQYGQRVEFSAQALPGETFEGIVSFVQPFLNKETRTVRVRVNVKNTDKRLKPGMFVTAFVNSRINDVGNVVGRSYQDSFICPMHPAIVKPEKGNCSICGMALVEAESLSFIRKTTKGEPKAPLVIPASAPLITGTRAIVYVKQPEVGRYELREVTLGPRAGDFYLVASGLAEGESVVTQGAFKLDADLQIRGAQSMMNPDDSNTAAGHQH